MGEGAALPHQEPRRLYSWWWDSHISPKNSKWLQENLADIDSKVKMMIKLIEEDADSFSRRAEMYYEKRPELMKLVEHFYRAYRALAERYDHATVELRQAHQVISGAYPDARSPPFADLFPPDPNLSPGGETEDGVRVPREAVERLTAERDALLIERAALEVSTAAHEAEARRLKDRCTDLEKTVFPGRKADMEDLLSIQARYLEEQRALSSEIRTGISALGEWGAVIKAGIEDLKNESSESLRNLLDENLNLRREREAVGAAASLNESRVLNLLEEIRRERDAVRLELEGVGKLLECSDAAAPRRARAEQIQGITVNLVKLLERGSRLEERQLAYDEVGTCRDEERRKLLSFVLLCGARLAAVENEARRLRQLASEADRTNLALEGEAEFFSGESRRLAAGIGEISVIFESLFGYGPRGVGSGETLGWVRTSVVRAGEERERLAVENSVLCVLLEGLAGSGAEACLALERENDGFALEVLNLAGMCVMLEDFGNERAEEAGRLSRDLDRLRTGELRRREMEEVWEGEAAGFYFDLQASAVWELVFERTAWELDLRSRRFENECRSNRAEAERWRDRARELESEAAEAAALINSLDEDIASLERSGKGVVLPPEGRGQEPSGDRVGNGRPGERGWDVEKMRRRVKAAGEEMGRMREEEKQNNKKLETAVKVIENLRPKKPPKRGPLKPTQEGGPDGGPPDRKGVAVKDILLDRASEEPLLGLWDEAERGRAGSWTVSCSSPGSWSAGSKTEDGERKGQQRNESSLVHPFTAPSVAARAHQAKTMKKKKGLCGCLRLSSPGPC